MSYAIARAREEHLPALPAIELQAATLFEGQNLPLAVLQETTTVEEFRAAMAAGYLWVALSPEGQPVGFAQAERHEYTLHLKEMDVLPEHGRRGIGRALVEAVCECARSEGRSAVTLTTFADLPWNAPFYQRLGFAIVHENSLSPELVAIVEAEVARGLPKERRVVMRRLAG